MASVHSTRKRSPIACAERDKSSIVHMELLYSNINSMDFPTISIPLKYHYIIGVIQWTAKPRKYPTLYPGALFYLPAKVCYISDMIQSRCTKSLLGFANFCNRLSILEIYSSVLLCNSCRIDSVNTCKYDTACNSGLVTCDTTPRQQASFQARQTSFNGVLSGLGTTWAQR